MDKKTKNIINTLKLSDKALDKKVKIQGTEYDRKCKISMSTLSKMRRMYSKGKTISEIAKATGIGYTTARYRLDEDFKLSYNAKRSGAHTGTDHITVADRIAYKRELVAEGKIS